MPEEEVSYYEIALTSRQVLVTFIVALACVALAFFAGVWVGQQGEGSATLADARAADAAEEAPALGFFTDSGDDAEEETAADEQVADTREPEPEPARRQEPEPEPETQPETRAETARPAATSRPVNTGAVAPSGSIVLQVLSSPNREIAEGLLTRLNDSDYTAYMQSFDTAGEVFYRVRVGPFADRSAAESAKLRIDEAFKVQTWITTAE